MPGASETFQLTTPRPISCRREKDATALLLSARANDTPPSALGPVPIGFRNQKSDFEMWKVRAPPLTPSRAGWWSRLDAPDCISPVMFHTKDNEGPLND